MTFRIAQISDTHISEEDMYQGVNSRKRLLEVFDIVKNKGADLVVLSGDLAAKAGGLEIYRWMKEHLDKLGIPYIVMPGNHDRVDEMRKVFSWPVELMDESEIFFKLEFHNLVLFFLDSSSGSISQKQLEWLKEQNSTSAQTVLLFIHHPPTLLFSEYSRIEQKYGLANRVEFFEVATNISHLKAIFCGHYHIAKEIEIEGKAIYVCPSSMLQADVKENEIGTLPELYGFRWIVVQDQNRIESEVIWI